MILFAPQLAAQRRARGLNEFCGYAELGAGARGRPTAAPALPRVVLRLYRDGEVLPRGEVVTETTDGVKIVATPTPSSYGANGRGNVAIWQQAWIDQASALLGRPVRALKTGGAASAAVSAIGTAIGQVATAAAPIAAIVSPIAAPLMAGTLIGNAITAAANTTAGQVANALVPGVLPTTPAAMLPASSSSAAASASRSTPTAARSSAVSSINWGAGAAALANTIAPNQYGQAAGNILGALLNRPAPAAATVQLPPPPPPPPAETPSSNTPLLIGGALLALLLLKK